MSPTDTFLSQVFWQDASVGALDDAPATPGGVSMPLGPRKV